MVSRDGSPWRGDDDDTFSGFWTHLTSSGTTGRAVVEPSHPSLLSLPAGGTRGGRRSVANRPSLEIKRSESIRGADDLDEIMGDRAAQLLDHSNHWMVGERS